MCGHQSRALKAGFCSWIRGRRRGFPGGGAGEPGKGPGRGHQGLEQGRTCSGVLSGAGPRPVTALRLGFDPCREASGQSSTLGMSDSLQKETTELTNPPRRLLQRPDASPYLRSAAEIVSIMQTSAVVLSWALLKVRGRQGKSRRGAKCLGRQPGSSSHFCWAGQRGRAGPRCVCNLDFLADF